VSARAASAATARATAFVAERRPAALALGRELAGQLDQPEAFAAALEAGLRGLADPVYRDAQARVAPGIGPVLGVRAPLLGAVAAGFRPALRRARPAEALWIAERLSHEAAAEVRLFAVAFLRRSLPQDPERTWQLIRRMGRAARDWVSVDTIADLAAEGVLREPYRWSELEQLAYAPNPWERRLVGSTLARMRHVRPAALRLALDAGRALSLVGELLGDADPNVRRALARALRELASIDGPATSAFLAAAADRAARENDAHRAWVVREALPALDPAMAARLHARLSSPHQPSPVSDGLLVAGRR